MTFIDSTEYMGFSPYFASLINKGEKERADFFKRFASLPKEVREFIVGVPTAEKVQALVQAGTVPTEFTAAVAKLICLAAMRDVAAVQIPSLLTKINFPEATREKAAQEITRILQGATTARAKAEAPLLKPLQPLVTHTPAGSTDANARGILDLRQPAP
jgi:hypothetical protein